MNAFGLGFGAAVAVAQIVWTFTLPAGQGPLAGNVWILLIVMPVSFGLTFIGSWAAVRACLSGVRNRDLRAEFRAADPRGRRSAAAGFLSGVVGVAALVGAIRAGGPSNDERDVHMFRFLALGLACLAASPIIGAMAYLRVYRPRPVTPPADPDRRF